MNKLRSFGQALVVLTLLAGLLAAGLDAAAQGYGQTGAVRSTGVGSIIGGDVALARDQAVDDALRKAVEQNLGMHLSSETMVQNYQVVSDQILSWSSGYVRTYKIVSEFEKSPTLYEVTVEAQIETGALARDAQAVQHLIQTMGNPRVMVMVEERNIGQSWEKHAYFSVDVTSAETAIMERFMANQFEVVDPSTVKANLKREQVLAALSGDAAAAAALGTAQNAEFVVTGKAIAKVASGINLGGMKSCQANVTLRVVKADVGRVIATGSDHDAEPHIDEVTGGALAIQNAAKKLSDKLIQEILEKGRKEAFGLRDVKLFVQGINSFGALSSVRNALQSSFRGIKNVFQRNMAGGVAELDLKMTGNADQLARTLEAKQLPGYSVKLVSLTQNKVTIKLTEAP